MGGSTGFLGLDWGFVAAVTGVVGIIVGLGVWFEQREREILEVALDVPGDRESIRADLQSVRGFDRYRERIARLNDEFEAWFGRSTSFRALDRCLLICFVYPLLLFLLAWVLGGPGEVAGISLLPAVPEWPGRLWRALVILVTVSGAFGTVRFVVHHEPTIGRFARRATWGMLHRLPPGLMERLSERVRNGIGAGAGAGAVAVAIAGAGAFAIAGAGAVAGAFAIAGAGAVAGAVAVAFAVAFAFAGAFAFAVAGAVAVAGAAEPAITIGLFFVVLPVVNAVFDWGSWIATRFFLRRAAAAPDGGRGIAWLTRELLFDILVGLVCLVGLAMALPNVIELFNLILARFDFPPVDWLAHLHDAIEAPMTRGALVTGMLATTLLPTAIHVYFGLAAVFFAFAPRAEAAAATIPAAGAEWKSHFAKQDVIKTLIWRRLWRLPAFIIAGLVLVSLTALGYLFLKPIGLTLADVAICATAWSHPRGCNLF